MSTYSGLQTSPSNVANKKLMTKMYDQNITATGYKDEAKPYEQFSRHMGDTFDIPRELMKKATKAEAVVTETQELRSVTTDFPSVQADVLEMGLKAPITRKAKDLSLLPVDESLISNLNGYKNDVSNDGAFQELYKFKLTANLTGADAITAVKEDGSAPASAAAYGLTYDNIVNIRNKVQEYKIPKIEGKYWKLYVDTSNEASVLKDLKAVTVDVPVEYRNEATIGKVLDFIIQVDDTYLGAPDDTYDYGEMMVIGEDAVINAQAVPWEAGNYGEESIAQRFVGHYVYSHQNWKKIWDIEDDKTNAIAKGYSKFGLERGMIINKHIA